MSPSQRSGINSTETNTPPMHTPEAPTSTALLATQQKLNAGTGASKEEHKNRMPGKSVPRGRSAQHNNERQKPTIHTTKKCTPQSTRPGCGCTFISRDVHSSPPRHVGSRTCSVPWPTASTAPSQRNRFPSANQDAEIAALRAQTQRPRRTPTPGTFKLVCTTYNDPKLHPTELHPQVPVIPALQASPAMPVHSAHSTPSHCRHLQGAPPTPAMKWSATAANSAPWLRMSHPLLPCVPPFPPPMMAR